MYGMAVFILFRSIQNAKVQGAHFETVFRYELHLFNFVFLEVIKQAEQFYIIMISYFDRAF
jgi:hypothetical protein